MSAIVQLTPVADSTTVLVSDMYSNQLTSVGGSSTVKFTTTTPSPALTVSAGGFVTTTGTLSVGTYTASGTLSDLGSDTGVWSFTLTVIGNISPQTGVLPSQAPLPTGVEILVPFQIDSATGGVAFLSDYNKIMAQHIATIILTNADERIMNPLYGFGLSDLVFTPSLDLILATTASDIKDQITAWEPGVNVVSVDISLSPQSAAVVNVTVTYSVVPFTDVSSVTVGIGGGVVQVVSA